jgi:hypothetical protein
VSTAAPVQAACPRCGGSLVPDWDEDLGRKVPKCLMCGRTPPRTLEVVSRPKAEPDRKPQAEKPSPAQKWATEQVSAAKGPVIPALAEYNAAVQRYAELGQQHRALVARERELVAQMASLHAQMQQAREKLDAALAALAPVQIGRGLPEQPCANCGQPFQPYRRTDRYCSYECKEEGRRKSRRKWAAKDAAKKGHGETKEASGE